MKKDNTELKDFLELAYNWLCLQMGENDDGYAAVGIDNAVAIHLNSGEVIEDFVEVYGFGGVVVSITEYNQSGIGSTVGKYFIPYTSIKMIEDRHTKNLTRTKNTPKT